MDYYFLILTLSIRDKNDGLKYVTSKPKNNGYNDSSFSDAVTPDFFQKILNLKLKIQSNILY